MPKEGLFRRLIERLSLSKGSKLSTPEMSGLNKAENDLSNASQPIDTSTNTIPSKTTDESILLSSDLLYTEPSLITPSSVQKSITLGLNVLYIPPTGLAPVVDIIFVHGLTGSAYDTWCSFNRNSELHWPKDLLKVDIPDARILCFGYDADIVGWWSPSSKNRIGNHAENLLGSVTRLREKTDSEDRSMIFVMHSLGGLVVQNALDLSRSSPEPHLRKMESRTVGLLFMGTPHFGADHARWGSFCTTILNVVRKTNKHVVQVLEPGSEMLATIQRKFQEILRLRNTKGQQPINITCFYEELPMPVWGTIVEMKSAILPGYASYGIHSTHTGMTRFESDEDKGYEDVLGELRRWTKSARETVTQTTDLQEECLRCLFFDGLDSREEGIEQPLQGTFSWIWDENKCDFLDWLGNGHGIYWIRGRASSGKSTLMKYIVNTSPMNAERCFGKEDLPLILSYFIDGKSCHIVAPSLEGIVRALLWQLLRRDARFFDFVLPHFQEMKRYLPTTQWKPSVLQDILSTILSQQQFCPLWLFLDGLDEFSGDLLDIADFCNKMAEVSSWNVRICISSRPEQEITHSISLSTNVFTSVLELERYTHHDITILATQEINRLTHLLEPTNRNRLIENLCTRANGLFMWAKIASRDIVLSCMKGVEPDTDHLLARLDRLPEQINELYLQILQKTKNGSGGQDEGLVMLGIVAFGKRSFTVREFSFILGITRSSTINAEEKSLRRKIDSFTGGLLDYRTGQVVFSHDTVSSFVHKLFEEQPDLPPLIEANRRLSDACLLLLYNFERPEAASQQHILTLTDKDGLRLRELRGYSIRHWLHHLRSSAIQRGLVGTTLNWFSITNIEIAHWHRLYLARYWEQPAWMETPCHPVATALAFLLLSVFPLEIFSDVFSSWGIIKSDDDISRALEMQNLHEDNLRSIFQNPVEWGRQDLDFQVTIDFAPGYSVSFHANQMLNSKEGNVLCIIDCPRGTWRLGEINEQCDWVQLLLESSSSPQVFTNPARLLRCSESDFKERPMLNREIYVEVSLLNQIKIVLWHCIQHQSARHPEVAFGESSQHKNNNDLQFATPVHYAAFNGLDLVIEKFHEFGANVNHVSLESRYGTALIAAIWGLSERRYATFGSKAVETLLRLDATCQSIDTAGNSGHLGTVTPLHTAIKLYTGYRKRTQLGSEELMDVVRLFVEEDAQIDLATRAIARSSPELRRYFSDVSRKIFSSWASQYSGTSPIPIPTPRSLSKSNWDPGNATIGDLGCKISLQTPRLVASANR